VFVGSEAIDVRVALTALDDCLASLGDDARRKHALNDVVLTVRAEEYLDSAVGTEDSI